MSGNVYYSKAPYLSQELADWLVAKRVRGVGLVNPPDKVDPPPRAGDAPIHHTLLGNDVLIIENLTNLDAITTKEFTVVALPLKIARGCGGRVARRLSPTEDCVERMLAFQRPGGGRRREGQLLLPTINEQIRPFWMIL